MCRGHDGSCLGQEQLEFWCFLVHQGCTSGLCWREAYTATMTMTMTMTLGRWQALCRTARDIIRSRKAKEQLLLRAADVQASNSSFLL
eukprot:506129-Rhodomonas_salina.1